MYYPHEYGQNTTHFAMTRSEQALTPALNKLDYYAYMHKLESREGLVGLQLEEQRTETWFELDTNPEIQPVITSIGAARLREKSILEVRLMLSRTRTLH